MEVRTTKTAGGLSAVGPDVSEILAVRHSSGSVVFNLDDDVAEAGSG